MSRHAWESGLPVISAAHTLGSNWLIPCALTGSAPLTLSRQATIPSFNRRFSILGPMINPHDILYRATASLARYRDNASDRTSIICFPSESLLPAVMVRARDGSHNF